MWVWFLAFLAGSLCVLNLSSLFKRGLPYPPGPPSKSWLLGSLSDIPWQGQWYVFAEWAQRYGGLVYFRALHTQTILVNTVEVAADLFEKQSNIFSSRPYIPMLELMGWGNLSSLKPYNDEWKAHNRIFHQSFKADVSRKYQKIEVQKINDMLHQLLDAPDDFVDHIRNASGAIIMAVMYGYDTLPKNDPFIMTAETASEDLAVALLPGGFLVNVLPALRFLPSWFPGVSFHNFAKRSKVLVDKMHNDPLDLVRARMQSGDEKECIAAELLRKCESAEDLKRLTGVCGTAYIAGADTGVSAVETFVYAMAKFPHIQEKAQGEIDQVIGHDRLPSFADRPSLPYVEALCRELLRWRPVLSIAPPRYMEQDFVYDGYCIPKGSNVIPNIWAMTRDSSKYNDPETFNPSRFLKVDGSLNDDNMFYAFGFGRRQCPGRHLGFATVWLSVVCVLSTFRISKKKDRFGNEIPIESGYNTSFVLHPLPFECSITPRSENAKALIQLHAHSSTLDE